MLMDWIDERRIEMQAEGRRHWVPSMRDFEQAMRDCWDDLSEAYKTQPLNAFAGKCDSPVWEEWRRTLHTNSSSVIKPFSSK